MSRGPREIGAPKASGPEEAKDAAHLRRLNLERVLAAAMAREGAFTRAELIEVTGLSAPTVGSLSSSLIRDGLLMDLGAGPSRGGRRPSRMEFNARHGFVAAIDLGPTRTRLGVADLRGELLVRRIVPTPHQGPTALLVSLARELQSLMADAGVQPNRLLAVGAGAPGVVDLARGMIVGLAPNLEGWSQVPMRDILADALSTRVVLDNDVNLAILGERWRGAARGHDTCAFLSFGTGIGAGIMVDGHLHHGHHFSAGEIGLMCMGPEYVHQDFGTHGCLETLAGLGALKAQWHPAESDGAGWIGSLFSAADAGDADARRTVDGVANFIGIAAANICTVLDPSLIVLGGALLAGGGLLERVKEIVARIIPMPATVVTTTLDKDAPLWGGLLVARTEARERLRRQLGHRRATMEKVSYTAERTTGR
jgi:predicted NBD/HSP70 family sugar kinase